MKCWACGRENGDDARFCQSCGRRTRRQASPNPPPAQAPAGRQRAPRRPGIRARPEVPNHLAWAILATILCCLPTGIIAIAYAAQVNGKLIYGDYSGAKSASDSARTWAIISMAIGPVVGAIWFFVNFF